MEFLAFYNLAGVGDVLLLSSGNAEEDHLVAETKGQVTLVKDRTNGQVVGINLHEISQHFTPQGQGQVYLTPDQEERVKQVIAQAGFDIEWTLIESPRFVVGYVEECIAHPDSDHLHITQTRVGVDKVLQIVCGAANIAQGLKVLVALPGAVMPDGSIIWPGQLRGEASNGMICSTRELGLENLENYPGIWELSKNFQVGSSLEEVVATY